nr:hypothetical protein BaRGS_021472 [Batillaria attramentaria]
MVKTCCAPQCHNKSKQPGISFFCFPKHPTVRREWIRRLKKENFEPTRHTVLCSQHFDSSCFLSESVPEFLRRIGLEQRPVRRRLRHGALPTLLVRRGNRWAEEGGGTGNGTAEDTEEKEEMEGEEEEEEEEESSVVIKEEPTDESYAVRICVYIII